MRKHQLVIVIFLCFLCSCATVLENVPTDFTPTEQLSIVFGRSEVIHDGKMIAYNGESKSNDRLLLQHVSLYNPDKGYKSRLQTGDFMFKTKYEDNGYFVCALPPGKYYFSQFLYMYMVPPFRRDLIATSTYIKWPAYELKERYLITFEVLPNTATYIGTLTHHCDTIYSNALAYKHRFKIEVADDYDEAKAWISSDREGIHNYTQKRIAEILPFEQK